MMHTETNEENLTAFIKLLDIAMCHEASIPRTCTLNIHFINFKHFSIIVIITVHVRVQVFVCVCTCLLFMRWQRHSYV